MTDIVRCSIRADKAIGNRARGIYARIVPKAGWTRVGASDELAGQFAPAVVSAVTEL